MSSPTLSAAAAGAWSTTGAAATASSAWPLPSPSPFAPSFAGQRTLPTRRTPTLTTITAAPTLPQQLQSTLWPSAASFGDGAGSHDDLKLAWLRDHASSEAGVVLQSFGLQDGGKQSTRHTLQRRGEEGDDSFGPGDYGWGTDITTEIVTVHETSYVPGYTTQYVTYGVTVPTLVPGGYVTISVYEGASTTITLTPNVVSYTIYPTETSFDTSTVTEAVTLVQTRTDTIISNEATTVVRVETTTVVEDDPEPTPIPEDPSPTDAMTATLTSDEPEPTTTRWIDAEPTRPPWASDEVQSRCWKGDAQEKVSGLFNLTPDQVITLYVIGIYLAGITLCWNLFFIRWLLYPFKTLTVAYHEFGHVLGTFIARIPLYAITIDPNRGGGTFTVPGLFQPPLVLFLGQISSIILGGALIFCGFDTLASKFASFVVGVTWFPVIHFQRQILTQVIVACGGLIIIGLWFLEHATGLRYYILFIGVLNSFYILWDTMDDFLHRKENACCVIVMETNIPRSTARRWFAIWLLASLVVVVGCILAALAHWRATPHAMYCRGQSFLPT